MPFELRDYQKQLLEHLKDPTNALTYLQVAFEEDGIEGFRFALANVAEAAGIWAK